MQTKEVKKRAPKRSKAALVKQESPKRTSSNSFISEYKKYFVAPAQTPDVFHVFDMTNQSSISYATHT